MDFTVQTMDELESEPIDDSRGCVHTFKFFPSLQSTHLLFACDVPGQVLNLPSEGTC